MTGGHALSKREVFLPPQEEFLAGNQAVVLRFIGGLDCLLLAPFPSRSTEPDGHHNLIGINDGRRWKSSQQHHKPDRKVNS